ncbi:NfeD family protein [Nocardioides sp. SYSU D00038]|uniref:NfeD family protein n=1 Tax=Nocardioides sp. SYSU D00038 TaxID=2812554 RepID=UPI00196750F0|nr:hypothetical protein [Nocardioides sp. SYSU D00038]
MTTFVVIGIVGLVLLGVSLVVGDLFDGALDVLGSDAFSSAVVGGFIAAFGFGAALLDGVGAPGVVSVPVGVAAGALAGWFAWWLTRLVRDGGSDATPSIEDALGAEGRVLSVVPTDGYGTVRVNVGGHTMQLNARANIVLEPGTAVRVTGILSPTAVSVVADWRPGQPSALLPE